MIFLLEYDRRRGRLLTFRRFADEDRVGAQHARLDLELARNRTRAKVEIVLLQAETEEALRITHNRYFQNPYEIAEATARRLR